MADAGENNQQQPCQPPPGLARPGQVPSTAPIPVQAEEIYQQHPYQQPSGIPVSSQVPSAAPIPVQGHQQHLYQHPSGIPVSSQVPSAAPIPVQGHQQHPYQQPSGIPVPSQVPSAAPIPVQGQAPAKAAEIYQQHPYQQPSGIPVPSQVPSAAPVPVQGQAPARAAEIYQQHPYQQHPYQQPMPGQMPAATPEYATTGQWTTGLFDCFDDMESCFQTYCCPCVTFGQIAEIVDRGSTSCCASGTIYCLIACCTGWHFVYTFSYRTRLRRWYSLPEEPFHDCLVHWCCHYCALCQEHRELHNRGFDVYVGWDDNMARMAGQGGGVNVPPPVQGGMTR